MFVDVPHPELIAHMQQAALRLLAPEPTSAHDPIPVLTAAAALAAGCTEPPPSNTLRVSGHVEATETRLAPDAGGRILDFTLEEGDRIEAGTEILKLDARDVELAIDRARADRAQAEANLRLVMAGARAEDIRQAESQVTAAQSEVSAARAELAAAEQDLGRFEALLASNSGSRKQRDDAATRRDVAKDRLSGAESRVRAARKRSRASRPAPDARRSTSRAPVWNLPTRRSPRFRRTSPTPSSARRSAASSPTSSSSPVR